MSDQENERIGEGGSGDSLWSMVREFYNRKMLGVIAVVWGYGLVFTVLAIYSGIRFFGAEQVKDQIMWAGIFICSVQFVCLMKLFAWQMIHRNSIKGQLRRLEARIAELSEAVRNRQSG